MFFYETDANNQNGNKEKHVTVNGSIILKNTDGYISSALRPLITFYLFWVIYYVIMMTVWLYQYYMNKKFMIALNWHILATLSFAFLECLLSYIFYKNMDTSPHQPMSSLKIFRVLTFLREVYARIMLLAIALGYQIVVKSLKKFRLKIAILFLLYCLSFPVEFFIVDTMILNRLMNLIIFTWILCAFRRTIRTLK